MKLSGNISLGVRDELYEGLWEADSRKKTVTFSFARPLPAPFNTDEVVRPFIKGEFMAAQPYQLGGEIVNEIIGYGIMDEDHG